MELEKLIIAYQELQQEKDEINRRSGEIEKEEKILLELIEVFEKASKKSIDENDKDIYIQQQHEFVEMMIKCRSICFNPEFKLLYPDFLRQSIKIADICNQIGVGFRINEDLDFRDGKKIRVLTTEYRIPITLIKSQKDITFDKFIKL